MIKVIRLVAYFLIQVPVLLLVILFSPVLFLLERNNGLRNRNFSGRHGIKTNG